MSDAIRVDPSAKVEIFFPTINTTKVGVSAEITRTDGLMDAAWVDLFADAAGARNATWAEYLQSGLPVKISWFGRGQWGEFHGYLHTVTRPSNTVMRVLCAGIGWRMYQSPGRADSTSSWRAAISQVCREHRLRFSTNTDSLEQMNITQGNVSDWSWIIAATSREGLSCHFRGATLLAQPFATVLRTNVNAPLDIEIPESGMYRTTSPSNTPVRSFVNHDSLMVDGMGPGASMYGHQNAVGSIANAVVGDGVPQRDTAHPSSALDAVVGLSPARTHDHRWTNRADLEMDGVPSLFPLDLVRTRNQGSKDLTNSWSVISVTHVIGDNDYTIRCQLGMEADSALLRRPANKVDSFMWDAHEALGSDRWYSTPVLRPTSKVQPGTFSMADAPTAWRWTAESVVVG